MSKIERLLADVRGRLGSSRFLGRRALTELRDHLHDSVAHGVARGLDESEAEDAAVRQIGTPDELVRSVTATSRGLQMIAFLKRHRTAVVATLAAPGVLLLGLSFLTFNFPCREVVYEYMGRTNVDTLCGTPSLETLRPLISEVGFYGGPAWVQWTIHVLAVMGPLAASLVILRSQVTLRRREAPERTIEIAFATDRAHAFALAATLSIFLTVVVYKAAG